MDNGVVAAKILVVDDQESSRYSTVRILRQAGYEVVEATNGDDALRQAHNGPDLVILDVNLPDMSGLDISRILRLDPQTSALPILQMSATYTQSSDKVRGLEAGADGYLVSPVTPEELLAHVRTLLRLKRAQDELRQRVSDLERARQELNETRELLSRQNDLLEVRVRERTAKLQETVQDLETFSYSITHDMRAPLRAMQGFSRLLLDTYAGKLDERATDYLERISSSAERLDLLIRDVLNYGNLAKTKLELVPVNLDKLLHNIVREYPGFQPPDAHIDFPENIPPVLGNEAFLTLCFANLFENAVKFVPDQTVPRVTVGVESRNDMVRLTVADNGIGIAQQHQGQLFKLFHRAQNRYPGTGVGLAVVRKAVERMGGQVGVESAPGKGSTFWVELREAKPGAPA